MKEEDRIEKRRETNHKMMILAAAELGIPEEEVTDLADIFNQ